MPSEMNAFALPGGGALRFSEKACEDMRLYVQTGRRPEAGGVLLGKVFDSGDVMVERVTVPGKGDKWGRYFFDRCRRRAQKLVNEAWKASHGETVYLGEWHTHPEKLPSPSDRDKTMIHNMLRETRMELSFLILVIIGLEGDWIGLRTDRNLIRLKNS